MVGSHNVTAHSKCGLTCFLPGVYQGMPGRSPSSKGSASSSFSPVFMLLLLLSCLVAMLHLHCISIHGILMNVAIYACSIYVFWVVMQAVAVNAQSCVQTPHHCGPRSRGSRAEKLSSVEVSSPPPWLILCSPSFVHNLDVLLSDLRRRERCLGHSGTRWHRRYHQGRYDEGETHKVRPLRSWRHHIC